MLLLRALEVRRLVGGLLLLPALLLLGRRGPGRRRRNGARRAVRVVARAAVLHEADLGPLEEEVGDLAHLRDLRPAWTIGDAVRLKKDDAAADDPWSTSRSSFGAMHLGMSWVTPPVRRSATNSRVASAQQATSSHSPSRRNADISFIELSASFQTPSGSASNGSFAASSPSSSSSSVGGGAAPSPPVPPCVNLPFALARAIISCMTSFEIVSPGAPVPGKPAPGAAAFAASRRRFWAAVSQAASSSSARYSLSSLFRSISLRANAPPRATRSSTQRRAIDDAGDVLSDFRTARLRARRRDAPRVSNQSLHKAKQRAICERLATPFACDPVAGAEPSQKALVA